MFKKIRKNNGFLFLIYILELVLAMLVILFFVVNKFKGIGDNISSETALVIMAGVFLLFDVVNYFVSYSVIRKTSKYINKTDITIASIFGNEVSPVFEFGSLVIAVYNEFDEIIWVSQTTLLKKEELLGKKIFDLFPNFEELVEKESSENIYANISGKTFQLEINTGLKVVYLKDVSTQMVQATKIELERPFFGNIVIDNFQDVSVSLNETEFGIYVAEVKEVISNFAKKYNVFVRSYGNDSFLIVGEEGEYKKIYADKFALIEEIRTLAETDGNPLTISIGIGRGNTTSLLRTSELAYMALNIALSRGGDQVVINEFGKQLEYFGAKSEVRQTRSHVRGRVLAASLNNLIKTDKQVLIMGHQNLDFDALGACLGVYSICNALKTKAYIVYSDNLTELQTKRAFNQVFSDEEIEQMVVSPTKALQIVDDETLVVVVDTHRPESTMQPKILENCKEICVVDHHRRGESFIDELAFQYHEPQSSSASELVTELIYYQPNKITISEKVANFMLAGICLDTKFFKSSTSSKTFEMAMILKNYQADVDQVSGFFKEEYEEMKLISEIVSSARAIAPEIYVAHGDDIDIISRTVLSKVAEEILSTKGVKAVFVVGKTGNDEVSASARSTNEFNVQIIMEALNGGGHFSKAATQLDGVEISTVIKMIEDKVKVYIRDNSL